MTLVPPTSIPTLTTPAPAPDLRSLSLPAVPQAVLALMDLLRSGRAGVDEIGREIEKDPTLATRVVGMANSPLFLRGRKVASIQDAIRFLGTATLRSLVVAAGLQGALSKVPGVDLATFWSDATTTAQAARGLARAVNADGEAAYLAGLLHCAGHLILCHALPTRAAGLKPMRPPLRGLALAKLERIRFGLDHAAVGAHWLRQMAMADEVVQAVSQYLDEDPRTMPQLARIVLAASTIAEAMDLGEDDDQTLTRLAGLPWWPVGIGLVDTEPVVELLARLREPTVAD
jgi:HD-like signal output (HDOD) protein